MEELVRSGLVKQIGLCNSTTGMIRDLLNHAGIRPSVLQVEAHPYLTQEKLLRYCPEKDIAFTAFSLAVIARNAAKLHPAGAMVFILGSGAIWRTESVEAGREFLPSGGPSGGQDPEWLFRLACLEAVLGDRDRTGELLRRACGLDPGLRSLALDEPYLEGWWAAL